VYVSTAELPSLGPSPVDFIGPFQRHEVVVNGWKVPNIDADLLPGGRVHLCLDNRFGIDLTVDEANRLVPFLADCIAVAMGYTAHPQEDHDPIPLPPFVRMNRLDDVPRG